MRIDFFVHSLASCWNHGNAHFLRGVIRALRGSGHDVRAHAPRNGWSLENLLRDHGAAGLNPYRRHYADLAHVERTLDGDVEAALDGADLVLVHEWNDPDLVAAIGRARIRGGRFRLLFHDTHHRAVTDPQSMQTLSLEGYDGVLAFGRSLADVYRRWGWGDRVFVWHEAADVTLFRPPHEETEREGLVWIGNWGDGERTEELEAFLFAPARACGLALDIYGVRYPDEALALLSSHGARYRGWLPNAQAPDVFARHMATVHVPRRPYARALPGIPTIRVFEALACGIPLVCAPWDDCEALFTPGEDYLVALDGDAMTRALRALAQDRDLRAALAAHGRNTILARHTCAHRADELLRVDSALRGQEAGATA